MEIVVVLVLVGILSAIAVARFPTLPKAATAAERLASDIQYAKELAIRTQIKSGIAFLPLTCTTDCTSYRVFENDNTSDPAIDPVTGGDFDVNLDGRLSGVELTSDFGDTLKFDSLGTPLDGSGSALGAPITITVSFGGNNKTITVEPNTGKVSGP